MRKGSRSPIGRKRTRRFTRNETEIFEGEAVIFRTTQGGKVWQFRTWIQEHQKYYRKSLRTKDKDAALEKGTGKKQEITIRFIDTRNTYVN